MNLSIDMINEKLNLKTQIYTYQNSVPILERPRLFSENCKIDNSKVLYVGNAQAFNKTNFINPGASLISIGTPKWFSPNDYPTINVLIIDENISLVDLFNRVLDIFLYFSKWETRMDKFINNNCELQDLIDCSDEVIGWPISIIDRAQKTLATSKFDESDDIIWQEICSGYIRTELLRQDSVQISEVVNYNRPIQRYSTVSKRIILTQPVRINNHVVGFIAIHNPNRTEEYFSKGIEHIVNYFTKFVAKMMNSNEFYSMSRGVMFEYLFVDLIEGNISDSAEISDRLLFINWSLDDGKILLSISSQCDNLKTLRDYIMQIIPNMHCVIYEKRLVAIISNLSDQGLSDGVLDQLEAWIIKNNLKCGISNLFYDLIETKKYYEQTKAALNLGKVLHTKKTIYKYSDYSLYHAILKLSESHDIVDFCHPSIHELAVEPCNRILIETLRVYLQNDCNITVSAKELFIHRNSMIYRINKLKDEIKLDLSDADLRLQLQFSFAIYDFIRWFYPNHPKNIYNLDGVDETLIK